MLALLLLLCIALLVVDWLQSRFIAENPERFSETNPILGEHPSPDAVDVYFICCIAATLVGVYVLPYWWALGAGVALAALEAFVTIRNYRRGIRI
jgi:hypothetical protein